MSRPLGHHLSLQEHQMPFGHCTPRFTFSGLFCMPVCFPFSGRVGESLLTTYLAHDIFGIT